jgi:transcriptional regulator with GAF, ATPase, and Fis domain
MVVQPAHLPRRMRSPSLSSAAAVKAAKGRLMRQRPKSVKPKAKLPASPKSSKNQRSEVRDLEKRLAEALKDKVEAQEQQTAISEILRAISSSPTDVQPVLDAVVKSAARFCGAEDAVIFQFDGDSLRVASHHGPVGQVAGFRVPVVRGTVAGRTVLERRAIHVADLQAEVEEFPEGSALARRNGNRTTLCVPLLRESTAIGAIQLRRAEVNPFTGKQVGLLQTFADQAVIAIENVRLFNETKGRWSSRRRRARSSALSPAQQRTSCPYSTRSSKAPSRCAMRRSVWSFGLKTMYFTSRPLRDRLSMPRLCGGAILTR